jgi:hypothetical protein
LGTDSSNSTALSEFADLQPLAELLFEIDQDQPVMRRESWLADHRSICVKALVRIVTTAVVKTIPMSHHAWRGEGKPAVERHSPNADVATEPAIRGVGVHVADRDTADHDSTVNAGNIPAVSGFGSVRKGKALMGGGKRP